MRSQTDYNSDAFSKCVHCNRLSNGDGNWINEAPEYVNVGWRPLKITICAACSKVRFPQFYRDVREQAHSFNAR